MSIWKSSGSNRAVDPNQAGFRVEQIDEAAGALNKRSQQVKIKSLEIAPDYTAECDPYNSTGQYCVLDFDR
jgi:hypothetical protein